MIVEFDSAFAKWLSRVNEASILIKIEKIILKAEEATSIQQIPNTKKLSGFKNYYRIKIGDYRLGFERINKTTIRFIIIAIERTFIRNFLKIPPTPNGNMKTKKENFKVVDYMRKKREELSQLHAENPKEYKKQLDIIRKKYASKFNQKKKNVA